MPHSGAKYNRERLFNSYLILISALGILLVAWAMVQLPAYATQQKFLLLIAFSAIAGFLTTSISIADKTGITYHIGSVVSIAALPTFGVSAAVLIAAANVFCGWLIKPANDNAWKRTWRQLTFNLGMDVIAIFLSGLVWQLLHQWLGEQTIQGYTVPWLVAAVLNVQINLGLLICVTWLQPGVQVTPWQMWRDESWSTRIDLLLMAGGGGLLAHAVKVYDWLGIIVFFLPIALSSYAFRLYVMQMSVYLNNLEQIVNERTKDLIALNDQKESFLSLLSHDMMTPLTNIRFSAEILQEDCISEEAQQLLQLILHSQSTLYHLVSNVVDLSKLQAVGALEMHKMDFNLPDLLTNVIALMRSVANQKDISLVHECGDAEVTISADMQQIERIFLNLLSNAIKYTPDGGTVSVTTSVDEEWVTVNIIDNGYGIPPEELPHLFERFRRVKQLELKATGNGLGLAISKALVEQHDGTITVTSEVNKGSVFSVKLPLQKS